MDKEYREHQIKKTEVNGDLADNTPDIFSSDGSLSFFKDDETKAWERSIFAPALHCSDFFAQVVSLSDREEQKEARNLLWKQDPSTVTPAALLPKNYLTQTNIGEKTADRVKPDHSVVQRNTGGKNNAARERSTGGEYYSDLQVHAGTQNYTGAQSRSGRQRYAAGQSPRRTRNASSHASGRFSTHDSAWEILAGNEPLQSSHRSMHDNPKRIDRGGLIFLVLLTFLLSMLIVISTFFFISRVSSDADDHDITGSDIFIGGGDEAVENNILTEFWDDHSDFYTSE